MNLKTFATNSHLILSHETNYGSTTGKMKKVENSTTYIFFSDDNFLGKTVNGLNPGIILYDVLQGEYDHPG